jgi:formylglycine-generating enzyme required for sulfatase activity
MSCPVFTARILLLVGMTVLCAPAAFAADPGMVFIPGGEFARGRAHEHKDSKLPYYPNPLRDDLPVRTIYVDPFYMDETEVTNLRYADFMKAKGHRSPYHWVKGQLPAGKEKEPVINVSWDDAVAFCAWDGKRLPTEAEWERACRGAADRSMYSWGNREPTLKDAHFSAQNPDSVCGDRARNYFGLCDMIGNVWEWTADWYGQKYYEFAPDRNPPGPAEGLYRVLRGGSWFDQTGSLQFLTCSNRIWARPNERSQTVGFRCAKSFSKRKISRP